MPVNLDAIALGSGIPDRVQLGRLAERIAERTAALCKRTVELQERVEAAQVKFHERALGDVMPAGQTQKNLTDAAELRVQRETRDYRKSLLAETAKEREELLRFARDDAAIVASVAQLFPNEVSLLSSKGIGTPERSRYVEQMRHAGVAELANYARLAIARRDEVMAVAVLGKLDAMPRDVRPFKATDFARKFVGSEFDELMGRVRAVKADLRRAINADSQLEQDRRNPTAAFDDGRRHP